MNDNDIEILNFKKYSFNRIQKDFDSKHLEKIAFLLTVLYYKTLIIANKKVLKDLYPEEESESVYLSNKELRAIIGKNTDVLILNELKRKRKIDIDYDKVSKYDRNKSYTFVSLNDDFFLGKNNIIGRKTIENEIYRNRLNKYYSENGLINKTSNAVLKQINETLRKTNLVQKDPSKEINKLIQRKGHESLDKILNSYTKQSERKQAIRRVVVRKSVKSKWKIYWQNYYRFMTENSLNKNPYLTDIFINLHQQAFGNRISHVYSNMPKEFRSLIKVGSTKVCEFDIKSSQPFFLYLLMKWLRNSNNAAIPRLDITSSYLDLYGDVITLNKDFYMLLKKRGGLENISRAEMKTLFYRIIFGDVRFKISATEKKVLCKKLIGPGFYEFLQFIQEHDFGDLHNKKQRSKNLAAILQKTESDCMDLFLSLLHANNVDAIPIYDAVLVPVNQQKLVKSLCDYFVDENPEYFGIKFTCKTEF